MNGIDQQAPLPTTRRPTRDDGAAVSSDPRLAWMRRAAPAVWRYLRHLGADRELADDLAQEVFVVALRRGFEPTDDVVARVFLRRTAHNLFRNALRRRRHLAAEPAWIDAVEAAWSTDEDPDDRLERLVACVEGLADRSRRIVRWFYADGWSRVRIAEELGLTEAGVKTALQRVRAALRDCVERRTEGER